MSTFFSISVIFAVLMVFTALYCILTSRNLIRILIGLELMTKAVTLLLAVGGYVSGRMALAQSFIITLIVIEVVIIAVAAGIVIGTYRHTNDLDARKLNSLKG
ncbi:MAG: NADH-quinone oxidoreductase subunit K [Kiritimatiellae bacterium]|nr:NADH-quinone oxidoreductase subunit K [Kiritimatiellia bacterium]